MAEKLRMFLVDPLGGGLVAFAFLIQARFGCIQRCTFFFFFKV